jgi:putative transcription factor
MVDCEMCGKKDIKPIKVKLEGSIMMVCSSCARFGERLSDPKTRINNFTSHRRKTSRTDPDANKFIVKNFAELIKNARESRNLKQEFVAKSLNEKESLIHKVESGHLKPSFRLARKLERFFRIKLIEEYNSPENISETDSEKNDLGSSSLTMEQLVLEALKKKK